MLPKKLNLRSLIWSFILLFLLFYTRFVGLQWGLPYPFHPDERNMANALQSLKCENLRFNFYSLKECFNPSFFAYGQFPLYLGYFLIQVYRFVLGISALSIKFTEATVSLRVISAFSSVINCFVLLKIIDIFTKSNPKLKFKNQKLPFLFSFLIIIFFPYFIQFSHFGTTESLLMLFYSLIIYYSLQVFENLTRKNIFLLSLFCGLAIATKISAFLFVIPVLFVFIFSFNRLKSKVIPFLFFIFFVFIFAIIFSPHNLISYSEFLSSMNYESAVALGKIKVFYTRQFEFTVPILFQLTKIFPYALGWPGLILSFFGFFSNFNDKKLNFLRIAFLTYFLPNAFLYTKWTRFMAPIFPILSVFCILGFFQIYAKFKFSRNLKFLLLKILLILLLIPGLSYLAIYQNPDVRFIASFWINKNIPPNSFILSETANVVDLPLTTLNHYQVISFNFYDVDENPILKNQAEYYLKIADYIIVPSRRIFANHYCKNYQNQELDIKTIIQNFNFLKEKKCQFLKERYPFLNDYYDKLFSGKLGFKKVAEFTSYPRLEFFGRKIIEFADEMAEETWSVFDHPVIRIYQRI